MLKETEASFFPGGLSGKAEIRLQKGLLMVPGWAPMELDRAYMNVRDSGIDVQSFRLVVPRKPDEKIIDKGSISFSGIVQPGLANTTQTLNAEIEAFSLPHLVGKDLGFVFSGRVATTETPESNFLTLTPGSGAPALLEVSLLELARFSDRSFHLQVSFPARIRDGRYLVSVSVFHRGLHDSEKAGRVFRAN